MEIKKTSEWFGSHYSFVNVTATKKQLQDLFGKPSEVNDDPDEDWNYEWDLSAKDDKTEVFFTLYDMYQPKTRKSVTWHVGINNDNDKSFIINALSGLGLDVKDKYEKCWWR